MGFKMTWKLKKEREKRTRARRILGEFRFSNWSVKARFAHFRTGFKERRLKRCIDVLRLRITQYNALFTHISDAPFVSLYMCLCDATQSTDKRGGGEEGKPSQLETIYMEDHWRTPLPREREREREPLQRADTCACCVTCLTRYF